MIDVVGVARDLIAIDSRSSVSDRPLVDFLAPVCRRAGLAVRLQGELRDGQRQYNLLAWRGEPREDALLLATHLDTVPPGDPALWTATGGDPFAATVRDGHLYGLGAADVKVDFLCKLAAVERLREESLHRPLLLAGTYGEETGRWGAKLLVGGQRPLPGRALVGEPSGLRPTPAHKGYVEFRVTTEASTSPTSPSPLWALTFAGRAAHSSQPHVGASANDACLDLLMRIARHRGDKRSVEVVAIEGGDLINKVAAACTLVVRASERPRVSPVGGVSVAVSPLSEDELPGGLVEASAASHNLTESLLRAHAAKRWLQERLRGQVAEGFEPPWSTVNNGLLHLTPGRLEYAVDVRSVPVAAADTTLDEYERLLDESRPPGGSLQVRRRLEAAPFLAAEGSTTLDALTHALRSLGLPTDPELKSGTTEAPVYQEAGMDTVVFGPGVATGNIHRPNERVPLAHLELAVDVYAAVVRRLCSEAGRA
jgi:acetylornithine deacetylase/succinyl-diaminopimelate desuccinylase-like protein